MRRYLVTVITLLLVGPLPARAQVGALANLNKLNRRLEGRVVDYTHNHGHDNRIFSPILGMPRDLYVYLPPGYDPCKAYPLVLYFHMGYIDEHALSASRWIGELDRMIACGEFPPAIVACPDGTYSGKNRLRSAHSMYINGCGGAVEDHVMREIIPFLTRTYSIRPEREAHALFGVSAGGMGAMSLAIRHREFFASVVTLAAPLNMRYSNVDDDNFEDFDPATYRWKETYDPREVVGRFYFGLNRARAGRYVEPVFGSGPAVPERVRQVNPADLLSTTDIRPGELAIYISSGDRDNWNFDAQADSFAYLAAQKGIEVTRVSVPGGRHNLPYFRASHAPAFCWLGRHLLGPTPARSSPG